MRPQPRELQPNDISLRYLLYESLGIAFFETLLLIFPFMTTISKIDEMQVRSFHCE